MAVRRRSDVAHHTRARWYAVIVLTYWIQSTRVWNTHIDRWSRWWWSFLCRKFKNHNFRKIYNPKQTLDNFETKICILVPFLSFSFTRSRYLSLIFNVFLLSLQNTNDHFYSRINYSHFKQKHVKTRMLVKLPDLFRLYIRVQNDHWYSRGTCEQRTKGSPVKPLLHEQIGLCCITRQSAFWPQVPGHGSTHL